MHSENSEGNKSTHRDNNRLALAELTCHPPLPAQGSAAACAKNLQSSGSAVRPRGASSALQTRCRRAAAQACCVLECGAEALQHCSALLLRAARCSTVPAAPPRSAWASPADEPPAWCTVKPGRQGQESVAAAHVALCATAHGQQAGKANALAYMHGPVSLTCTQCLAIWALKTSTMPRLAVCTMSCTAAGGVGRARRGQFMVDIHQGHAQTGFIRHWDGRGR